MYHEHDIDDEHVFYDSNFIVSRTIRVGQKRHPSWEPKEVDHYEVYDQYSRALERYEEWYLDEATFSCHISVPIQSTEYCCATMQLVRGDIVGFLFDDAKYEPRKQGSAQPEGQDRLEQELEVAERRVERIKENMKKGAKKE